MILCAGAQKKSDSKYREHSSPASVGDKISEQSTPFSSSSLYGRGLSPLFMVALPLLRSPPKIVGALNPLTRKPVTPARYETAGSLWCLAHHERDIVANFKSVQCGQNGPWLDVR